MNKKQQRNTVAVWPPQSESEDFDHAKKNAAETFEDQTANQAPVPADADSSAAEPEATGQTNGSSPAEQETLGADLRGKQGAIEIPETGAEAVRGTTPIGDSVQLQEQLRMALSELENARQKNKDLVQVIEEMSRQRMESAAEAQIHMPEMDLRMLAAQDEKTAKEIQKRYAQDMADYVKAAMMQDLEPFVKQAKEGVLQKERAEVLEALKQLPEMHGIEEMAPKLDRIIQNTSCLSSEQVPTDEKYILAYAIARGVEAINRDSKGGMTPEELLELYEGNPEFQDLVERRRGEKLKAGQKVPPMSAGGGAAAAALNIKEKPKNFEEATRRTMELFR